MPTKTKLALLMILAPLFLAAQITPPAVTGAPPTGAAGGALTGNYPNPTIAVPATLTYNALGTTPTNAITLLNSTPAAAGAQQYSPAFEWIGQGWATGTGLSTPVGFRSYVVPVQGTTTASSYLGLFYHPAVGADVLGMSVLPSGNVGIGTTGPAALLSLNGGTTAALGINLGDATANLYRSGAGAIKTDGDFTAAGIVLSTGYYGNSADISFNAPTGYSIKIRPNGSVEAARFNASGNLLLGSVTDNSNGKLQVTGGATISGNVGIGTTGPVSKLHIGSAPVATPNSGTFSLGSGSFDGTTTGYFVGSANGTHIAVNMASGSTADFANWQVAGVSQFKVTAGGVMTLAGATFVLGGHTCSIVATVLTCP